MFQRIIVPLDGSPIAESTLPLAAGIARRLGARLVLIQAVTPAWWLAAEPAPTAIAIGPDVVDALLAGAGEYLEPVAERLRRSDLSVETEAVLGSAASVIAERAAAEPGTLVVMATHGRSGLSRAVLGSVALAVVGAGICPVLLVRPDAPQPQLPRRIVVPLDGSARSEAILPIVEGLARTVGAAVVLCRVRSGGELPNDVDRYLGTVAEQLERRGLSVDARQLDGDPAGAIVEAAGLVDADLVAMATHGRTDLGSLVFGSVAEQVLARAPAPVLLVKPGPRLETRVAG
ncbi:MAG: universal stress protein [Chloroflexi bacterium]|nr:universal stress protein [Chloroflexota bacterium]